MQCYKKYNRHTDIFNLPWFHEKWEKVKMYEVIYFVGEKSSVFLQESFFQPK